MQSIIDHNTVIHPIFDDIKRLYAVTSTKNTGGTLIPPVFSDCFRDVFSLFSEFGGVTYDVDFTPSKYEKLKLPKYDPKNIIVCFSGGKDSTAAALHYKKLKYNVYLYHVTGLNKTYYDEWKSAEKIAQYLKMPLIIEDVSYSGNHEWVEHPIKNMVCASMALQYGIRNNIGIKIATGNFTTSSIIDDPFDVCSGDTVEMWRAYETIIRSILPKFKVYISNTNYQTAFNTLSKVPELIPLTISCLSSNRFRGQRRKWNIEKYGHPKIENRCGSCWKCAVEYIWFTDHGVFEYDAEYYKHCLQILQHSAKKEIGYSMDEYRTWNYYFFYDYKKSKYWR